MDWYSRVLYPMVTPACRFRKSFSNSLNSSVYNTSLISAIETPVRSHDRNRRSAEDVALRPTDGVVRRVR
jgi:hypothetical protein